VARLMRQTRAQMLAAGKSPLVSGPQIRIALADPVCQAYVSGAADDAGFRSAAEAALGFALPVEPNRLAGNATYALWIAPERWLVVSDDAAAGSLATTLAAAVSARGGFVSEITDGLAVFELSGPSARELLAMGCALDFDDASLAPGRSARALFAGVNAILYPHRSRDRYRLHVEHSLARHLFEWFEKAATALA